VLARQDMTSALPPKADIAQHRGDVRFVPKADIGPGSLIHHNLDTCIAIKQLFELEARKLISGLFADMRGKGCQGAIERPR
jgi:hypothetical protein